MVKGIKVSKRLAASRAQPRALAKFLCLSTKPSPQERKSASRIANQRRLISRAAITDRALGVLAIAHTKTKSA